MSRNTCVANASIDAVWDILADGWLYPLWVVGAARIRDVDASWPDQESQIHHSIGMWPILIDDTTEVLSSARPHHLRLYARGWPIGGAKVDIKLRSVDGGTEIVMEENAVSGPGALVPEPIKGISLRWRNHEALRRLKLIAENRQA